MWKHCTMRKDFPERGPYACHIIEHAAPTEQEMQAWIDARVAEGYRVISRAGDPDRDSSD